jgi:hypothetical protein
MFFVTYFNIYYKYINETHGPLISSVKNSLHMQTIRVISHSLYMQTVQLSSQVIVQLINLFNTIFKTLK